MNYGLTKECKCAVGLYLLGSVKVEEAQEGGTPTDAVLSRPADGGLYVYSVHVCVYMYIVLQVVLCCFVFNFLLCCVHFLSISWMIKVMDILGLVFGVFAGLITTA